MTEKIARRGIRVPTEYAADFLDQILVRDAMSKSLTTLRADQPLAEVHAWMQSRSVETEHQGFPVVDESGNLTGVVTRRSLFKSDLQPTTRIHDLIQRQPVVYDGCTLRQAADHMVRHEIGRLPVISRKDSRLVGIITRSDLLMAHRKRLHDAATL